MESRMGRGAVPGDSTCCRERSGWRPTGGGMMRPHPLLSFPSFQTPWPSLEAGTCSPPRRRQRRFLLLRILPRPIAPESALSPAAEPDSVETPGRVWRTVHARDLLTGSVRRFQVLGSVGDSSVIGGPDGPDQPPDGDHDP